MDLSNNTTFLSPGIYRLIGVKPQANEVVRFWSREYVHPDDVAGIQNAIDEAINTQAPFYYRLRTNAAPIKFIDTHGEVEFDGSGNAVALFGICHDVTRLVLAERERDEAKELHRLVAQKASDVILVSKPDGTIVFASDAIERVLDISIDEIGDSQDISRFVHLDDLDNARKAFDRLAPDETLTVTYRVRRHDGDYIWVESTSCSVYSADEHQYTISVTRDISERKAQERKIIEAQERAEAASRAKSTFLANMSHELRTPLNAVIGFSDVMKQKLFGPLNARYHEYAHLIHDSGQHLLDLVSDLLDMAKIEAGKFVLSPEQIDLTNSIRDCVHLVQIRAKEKGVTVTTRLPKTGLSLVADRTALRQILINLLSNAVKFTPTGGKVVVTAKAAGNDVFIEVRDTGIGIPATALARLGRPFEQVTTDPTLARGGTGLGLALVHALVARHGGTVRIDSKEGFGTTVSIRLGLALNSEAA
jgi:PAS domain S-box-containing protein